MVYKRPIDHLDGFPEKLWDAIDAWAKLPAIEETLEQRVQAAAAVEAVVSEALDLAGLINARMALAVLLNRLRDGGPDMSREQIRDRLELPYRVLNAIVPASPLRSDRDQ